MHFSQIFDNLPMPVLVCSLPLLTLTYQNASAKRIYGRHNVEFSNLEDYLSPKVCSQIIQTIDKNYVIKGIQTKLDNNDSKDRWIEVSGTVITSENQPYIVLYIKDITDTKYWESMVRETRTQQEFLNQLLFETYYTTDMNKAIHIIMKHTGKYLDISRIYIFEGIPVQQQVSKTYEWNSEDLPLEIITLDQVSDNLVDYSSKQINRNGLLVVYDVNSLDQQSAQFLKRHNINSLVIFPIIENNKYLGFMAFDDCRHMRSWNESEIQLLHIITSIIASLIARRRAHDEIQTNQSILRVIMNNLNSIIYVSDMETHEILFANQLVKDMIGCDVEGRKCYEVFDENCDSPCSYCPQSLLMNEDRQPVGMVKSQYQNTVNGLWYHATDSAIPWYDGRYVHLRSALEINEQKKLEQQLAYQADRDAMTGAYNHKKGKELLSAEIIRLKSTSDGHTTICFIDINDFKTINDQKGHMVGDKVIILTADILSRHVRDGDIICRYGGDELLIIMPNCGLEAAKRRVKNIRADLLKTSNDTLAVEVTISVGILEIDSNIDKNSEEIIADADQLMYEDKTAYKASRAQKPGSNFPS